MLISFAVGVEVWLEADSSWAPSCNGCAAHSPESIRQDMIEKNGK